MDGYYKSDPLDLEVAHKSDPLDLDFAKKFDPLSQEIAHIGLIKLVKILCTIE